MKRSYLFILFFVLLSSFALAAPGDILWRLPNSSVTNDWKACTSDTCPSGTLFLTYTSDPKRIVFNGSGAGLAGDAVNVTGQNWTNKTINMTFIFQDDGVAFSAGQNFALGWGNGTVAIHSPVNNGFDFTINSCNGGPSVYMTEQVANCAKALAPRTAGNHTVTLWWNTSASINNAKTYIDGVLNAANGTMNISISPSSVIGSIIFSRAGSNVGNYSVYNLTVCEQYCAATVPTITNMTISVNDTRSGTLISGFNWNYTTNNASDNNTQSGYCSTTTCSITNFTGTLNITVFNVSGGTFFNPQDSPKLSFFYNSTGSAAQQNYTFNAFQTSLRVNLTNSVNNSALTNICVSAFNGSATVSGCNTTGATVTLFGIIGNLNITANATNNDYFPVNFTLANFNTTNTNLTNSTYQSILNISALQLYTLSHIQTFNITNWLLANQTTSGSLMIRANNGSNNLKVDVPGNYSLNATCTGTALQTVQCNVTGIYDDVFKVNATDASTGSPINTFSVNVRNVSIAGLANNGLILTANTTNGSAFIPLLQGYVYNFEMNSTAYAITNLSRAANASTNTVSFSLLAQDSIFVLIYDERTLALITQNISVTYQNTSTIIRTSTTTGASNVQGLAPGVWIVTAVSANSSSDYGSRQQFVTVVDQSATLLNMYLLSGAQGTSSFFTIKDGTTAATISNATVTLQVYNNGNWVTADQKLSDLFGVVTFNLQPHVLYQLIVTADGYNTKQGQFYAELSSYVVVLDNSNTQNFITYGDDFSYLTSPSVVSNNVTTFSLTVSSPQGTIEWFALQTLVNGTTTTQNLSTSPSGGTLNIIQNLTPYLRQQVTATYFIKSVNFDQPLVITKTWFIWGNNDTGNYTLTDFMEYYKDDTHGLTIASRGLLSTVGAVILGALLGFIFGSAAAIVGASAVFMVAAFYGWIHWTIIIIVVGGLLGGLLFTGRGR